MEKREKIKKYLMHCFVLMLILTIIWFIYAVVEYIRVDHNKRPLICFNSTKEIESNIEYSKRCNGILTKYKEYYNTKDDKLTGREYVIVFKDFDKSND